jgi:hypothetical protein
MLEVLFDGSPLITISLSRRAMLLSAGVIDTATNACGYRCASAVGRMTMNTNGATSASVGFMSGPLWMVAHLERYGIHLSESLACLAPTRLQLTRPALKVLVATTSGQKNLPRVPGRSVVIPPPGLQDGLRHPAAEQQPNMDRYWHFDASSGPCDTVPCLCRLRSECLC